MRIKKTKMWIANRMPLQISILSMVSNSFSFAIILNPEARTERQEKRIPKEEKKEKKI